MEQPHYSTQPHYMGHPLKEIPHPHPHDVLCGRGGGTNAHIGNSHWRMLVAANKELYCSLPKKQKMLLSKSIVNAVRSQNPPGRFLQKDSHSELWYDVGDQRATEKTSQALREGAPEIRTKLKEPVVKGSTTGTGSATGPSTTTPATSASTPPTPVQPVASSSSASSYQSGPPPQGAPPAPPMRPMVPTSSGMYVPAPPPPHHHIMPPLVDRHSSGLALPAPVPAQGPVPQRSRSKKMESSSGAPGASTGAPGPSSGPSGGVPGPSSGAPGASSQPYPQQEHPQRAHHPQQQYQHHQQQPRYPSAQQAPPPQHYPQQPPPPYQKQQPYPPRQGPYDFEPMPFHPVDSSVPTLRQEAPQQQNQQQQHMRPPVHTPNSSQFGSYREPSQPSYEETGPTAGGAAFPEPPTGLDDNGGFSFGSIVMTDAEEMRLRHNFSLGTGTAPKRPSGSEPPGNHNNHASSANNNNNNGNSHSDKHQQDRDAALPTTVAPPDGGLQDIGTSFGSMMSIGTAPKLDANGGFSFGSAMSFSVNAAAVTAVDGGLEAIGTSFGSLSLATNDRQRMLGDNNKHTNDDDDEAAAGAVPTFLQQHKSKGNLLDCSDTDDSDHDDNEGASAAAASRNKSLEYEKLKATLEERKYAPATMMPPPLTGGGGPTTTTTTSRSSHSYYGAPPTHSLNIPAPSFDRDFSQMSAISVGDDDFQHYPPVIPYAGGGGASGGDNSNNNNGFSSDMPPPPPAMRKGDADDVWRDDSGDLEPF